MTTRPRSKGKPPLAAQPTSAEPLALPIDPSADPAEIAAAVVPTHFPIVGIGASAGGLSAFEAFFAGMPPQQDPDMAFVLVQHLAPDHKSILSELIRHYTRMQVLEVEDGMQVQINCTYIIPPNYDMAFLDGTLHLFEPLAPRGQRLPIDYLFRSLANDQRELAIGIVLSGTGSDGTQGLQAIKAAGGMVIAQTPDSCEFDGMPRSAIATGLVDYQLPPEEMAAQLIHYANHALGKLPRSSALSTPITVDALKKIFVLLRAQTGHDFSQYKPSTINRRIERRMVVHQLETIAAYVKYLQQTPLEVEALFRDLLIGVTSFFRDKEAFQALEEQVIPKLFEGKPPGTAIRVWSTGCSSGEEAYSLAILLVERMEVLKQRYLVQVFATDIDSRAIATARAGLYPLSIIEDLGPERLARFFTLEPGGLCYRIHKGLRDLLVFSEQDLVTDPPFSKLDLICCRNLLIYLNATLQKKLIPLFHYALLPGGKLFLGTSEGIGEFEGLFNVLDRKAKLYESKDDLLRSQRGVLNRLNSSMATISSTEHGFSSRSFNKPAPAIKLPLRELMEQALLRHLAPAAALVNAQGDIAFLYGRTGMYLEPAQGEGGIQNILRMAREGLRASLSNALHRAVSSQHSSAAHHLRVKTNGHFTLVDLDIYPVPTGAVGELDAGTVLYIVHFRETPALSAQPGSADHELNYSHTASDTDAQARILALTQELRAKEEYLQSTQEELESSNEELKSSNEEMQSVNEELQSANEELETSKEELQSVNEELATVNSELHAKVNDLTRVNNDMNNLLAGTGVGTVFVDFQLRILRFTPAARAIINLIESDVGRNVSHIVSNLVGYSSLIEDVKLVLDSLIPKEVEVQTLAGQWYTLRIQPYRTLNNVIEGAVISFVEITAIAKARLALEKSILGLRQMIDLVPEMMWLKDHMGKFLLVNQAHAQLYNMSVAQLTGRLFAEVHDNPAEIASISRHDKQVLTTGKALHLPEESFLGADGQTRYLHTTRIPFHFAETGEQAIFGFGVNITQRKTAEETLHQANDQLRRLAVVVHDAYDAVTVHDLEGNTLAWNPAAVRLYGWSEEQALHMNLRQRIPESHREEAINALTRLSRAEILQPSLSQRLTHSGAMMEVSITATALLNVHGEIYAIATTERHVKGGER